MGALRTLAYRQRFDASLQSTACRMCGVKEMQSTLCCAVQTCFHLQEGALRYHRRWTFWARQTLRWQQPSDDSPSAKWRCTDTLVAGGRETSYCFSTPHPCSIGVVLLSCFPFFLFLLFLYMAWTIRIAQPFQRKGLATSSSSTNNNGWMGLVGTRLQGMWGKEGNREGHPKRAHETRIQLREKRFAWRP